jgi:hypothetical protein
MSLLVERQERNSGEAERQEVDWGTEKVCGVIPTTASDSIPVILENEWLTSMTCRVTQQC